MTEELDMSDPGSPDTGKPNEGESEKTPQLSNEQSAEVLAGMMQSGQQGRKRGGERPRRRNKEESREKEFPEENALEDNIEESGDPDQHVHPQEDPTIAKVHELKPGLKYEDLEESVPKMFDPNTSPDEFLKIVQKMEFTKDMAGTLVELCRANDVPEDKIEIIKQKMESLPEKEEVELTEEEEKENEEAHSGDGGLDQLQEISKEAPGLIAKAARGEATEEEISEFREKAGGIMEKVKDRFFNGDNGYFRAEKRFKRLVLKPIVTLLLVTMLAYLASLSLLTSGAAKRIAK